MADYPDDEEIKRIREWPADDPAGWLAFIKSNWWAADWGWTEGDERVYRGGAGPETYRAYSVSTGGWSGNEDRIAAMQDNAALWLLTWYVTRRGGHYEFRVDREGA